MINSFLNSSRLEPILRLIVGMLLWGISATLTLGLLLSLTDRSLLQGIGIGVIAISLEGTKILTFWAGGKTRILAIVLICLSGIASLGAALEQVATASSAFHTSSVEEGRLSPTYIAATAELHSLDSEIASLVERLGKLPADYVTASTTLTKELQALRDRRQGVYSSIDHMEFSIGASQEGIGMVALLAKTAGLKPEALLFFLLLVVSGAIEAGALILTATPTGIPCAPKKAADASEPPKTGEITSTASNTLPRPSYTPPMQPSIDPETFLHASMDGADLPFLHGRDKTAKKLGLTYAEGKRLVSQLLRSNKIQVKGKRLRLLEPQS